MKKNNQLDKTNNDAVLLDYGHGIPTKVKKTATHAGVRTIKKKVEPEIKSQADDAVATVVKKADATEVRASIKKTNIAIAKKVVKKSVAKVGAKVAVASEGEAIKKEVKTAAVQSPKKTVVVKKAKVADVKASGPVVVAKTEAMVAKKDAKSVAKPVAIKRNDAYMPADKKMVQDAVRQIVLAVRGTLSTTKKKKVA